MRRLLCTRPKVSIKGVLGWLNVISCSGMDPLRGPIRPMLLLPDRHELLEPIDGMAAGVERLMPMRATDGHRDADVADFQVAQTMLEDDLADGPARARVLFDLVHLLDRHLGIGVIVEGQGRALACQIAHRAEKRDDGTAMIAAHLLGQASVVDRFTDQPDHAESSSVSSPLIPRSPAAAAPLRPRPATP